MVIVAGVVMSLTVAVTVMSVTSMVGSVGIISAVYLVLPAVNSGDNSTLPLSTGDASIVSVANLELLRHSRALTVKPSLLSPMVTVAVVSPQTSLVTTATTVSSFITIPEVVAAPPLMRTIAPASPRTATPALTPSSKPEMVIALLIIATPTATPVWSVKSNWSTVPGSARVTVTV